jgi:hypothetical protein
MGSKGGTNESTFDVAVRRRLAMAKALTKYVSTHSHGYELILEPPPGIANYMQNRARMSKEHGELSRETGKTGLTFNARVEKHGKVVMPCPVELIPHTNKYHFNVQVKTWETVPTEARALALIGKRVYLIAFSPNDDFEHPVHVYVCSGQRITAKVLTIYHDPRDKNKVRANFTGLAPNPLVPFNPRGLWSTARANVKNHFIKIVLQEMHYVHR